MSSEVYDTSADAEAAYGAAEAAVRAGHVIVLPTDTVYGVGADAFSGAAVQALLDAKQRGRDMPPPVLVAEVAMVRALASNVDDRVVALGQAFWPGALTLVLRAHDSLRLDLGDRADTIAVRVPDHDVARELLRRTGPLAVSSANVSGRDAALTIGEAHEQLGDAVAVYLDAGEMSGPVPSTIVDLSGDEARILRAGRITVDDLNSVVPGLIHVPGPEEPEAPVGQADAAASDPAGDAPSDVTGPDVTGPDATADPTPDPAPDDRVDGD